MVELLTTQIQAITCDEGTLLHFKGSQANKVGSHCFIPYCGLTYSGLYIKIKMNLHPLNMVITIHPCGYFQNL